MTPGRELDALVAEKVMGWKRLTYAQQYPTNINYSKDDRLTMHWHSHDLQEQAYAEDCDDYYAPELAWSPSTDIRDAWEVIYRLKHLEPELVWSDEHQCWHMTLWKGANQGQMPGAATAPHAICLAALRAVGVEV